MKTLFQTAAILAALSVPAFAFDPIPFNLTFPTQPLWKSPMAAQDKHSKQNSKAVVGSKVKQKSREKSRRLHEKQHDH